MVTGHPAQIAYAAILTGLTLSATAGACWAHSVVHKASTLPPGLAGRAQLAVATAAGALLAAGLTLGSTLFMQRALELAQ